MKILHSFIFLLLSLTSFTQDEIVVFNALVVNESGKPMKDAILKTYKGDTLFRSDTTTTLGEVYNIVLPIGSSYHIEIGKKGYISKIAAVDAHFYSESNLWTEHPNEFIVTLFEECEAGNFDFMKTVPLIKYKYDSTLFFKYDKDHLEMMRNKVEKAKYANLSREDQETFTTDYYGGIELMEFQNYVEAKEMLLKAREIVNCSYVSHKIKECEDLQKLQEEYDRNIKEADLLFDEGNFNEASKIYGKCVSLKPNEQYPNNRMQTCDYKVILIKADQYFTEKDYELALDYYIRALDRNPGERSFVKKYKKCRRKTK